MMPKGIVAILLFTCSSAYAQSKTSDCEFNIDSLSGLKIYSTYDQIAQPEFGVHVLFSRMGKEIELNEVQEESITGSMTLLSFVVTENGEIIDMKILKEEITGRNIPAQMFDIVESTTWQPAICNGKAVASVYKFPLRLCFR